jgi:hypothetical protein
MENKRKLLLKFVVAIIAAAFLYLFALNGRYAPILNGKGIFDKWNNCVYQVGSREVPIVIDGTYRTKTYSSSSR